MKLVDGELLKQLSRRAAESPRRRANHNLHDRLHVVQDGVLVDVWPIAARGCAQ